MPKISVITPIFNGERFVMEAANSILSQSSRDWEWIIINDGSTDGTPTLLKRLEDQRIRVIHQSNAGASAARNVGLDLAGGAYVTFLDIDDLLPSDALELRAAYLDAQPRVDVVNGGVRVTKQGQILRRYCPDLEQGPLQDRLARLEEGVFFSVNYMLRRSCILNHRFIEGLSHCEDLVFFLTLAHERGLTYGAVPEIVYNYRVHPSSAMSSLEGIEEGYLELIRHSKALPKLSYATRHIQKKRVQRILVRSWLRKFRPDRAIGALWKLRRI